MDGNSQSSTSPWVVSGTVSVNPITFASPQHVIVDSGTLTSITNAVTVNQGTSPWVVSGTVTTSPDVNVHDGTGVSISSTGSSLNVNVTNTVPVSQSGAWTVTANQGTSPWVVSGTVSVNPITFASPQHVIVDSGTLTSITNAVTVNQGTSPWVVSGTVTAVLSYDTNYGTVGANTLRTASQIGNATGAADFNAGATGAQTLRVTANQGTSPWVISGAVTLPYDTNYGTAGATTLRTAAQIGNATGAANFGAGATSAQTLRTTANLSDGAGTALTSTLFNSKQSLDVRPNTGFSTGSNTRPAVTSTSSTILASNVNRKFAYIFNQTGSIIFLKFGATAVVNQGIRLADNATYEIDADNLWTGDVMAVKSAAASVNIEVFEGTI